MANSQVKMKRTRVNVRHLDQHTSLPVIARSSRGCGIEGWWRRGKLKQHLLPLYHALDRHVPILSGLAKTFIGMEVNYG